MGEYAFVIRTERRRVGLSQSALAARAGIHRTTLSHLENGSRYPRIDVVFQLMDVLGVSSELVVLAAYKEDPRLRALGEASED